MKLRITIKHNIIRKHYWKRLRNINIKEFTCGNTVKTML